MIKIVLADDHKIVLDGLVSILENELDIDVVGTASDGQEVIDLLSEHSVDIAVLDIEMPKMTGVQLSEYIKSNHPKVKVLILSMYKSQDFVKRIISAGAKGYILKNRGSEELVKAIRYIHAGQSYIGQEITDVLFEAIKAKNVVDKQPRFKLSRREKEVLALIVTGKTSRLIGDELHIAASTVDTYRRNLIEKTGVANSKELIGFAIKTGLV